MGKVADEQNCDVQETQQNGGAADHLLEPLGSDIVDVVANGDDRVLVQENVLAHAPTLEHEKAPLRVLHLELVLLVIVLEVVRHLDEEDDDNVDDHQNAPSGHKLQFIQIPKNCGRKNYKHRQSKKNVREHLRLFSRKHPQQFFQNRKQKRVGKNPGRNHGSPAVREHKNVRKKPPNGAHRLGHALVVGFGLGCLEPVIQQVARVETESPGNKEHHCQQEQPRFLAVVGNVEEGASGGRDQ